MDPFYLGPLLSGAPSNWGLFYLCNFYLTPISLRPLLIGPLIPGGTSARSPFCLGLLQFGNLLHGVTINYAGSLETLGRCKHFERPLYFASRPAPRRLWGCLRHHCPETNKIGCKPTATYAVPNIIFTSITLYNGEVSN